MDVLVVLPTYNESENIDRVLRRIRAALPDATVLVVDDGSPDGTADQAEILGKELGRIEVMRRAGKSGLGSAYRAGFRWGLDHGFEACIEMDADLSHEPEALPDLVAPLERRARNWSSGRGTSRGGHPQLGLAPAAAVPGGQPLRLPPPRPRGVGRHRRIPRLRRPAADRIDLDAIRAEGYGFQIEMTYEARRAGAHHPRGADPVRRPGGGRIQDVDLHRGRGPRPGDAVGDPAAGSAPKRRTRQVDGSDAPAGVRVTGPARPVTVRPGSGPTVLLLHGQPGTGASWDPVTDRLVDGFRVLAPDRPGLRRHRRARPVAWPATPTGRRPAGPRGGPATVVAHSWAGGVAVLLADRRPDLVAGLVLVGAACTPDSLDVIDRLLALPASGTR